MHEQPLNPGIARRLGQYSAALAGAGLLPAAAWAAPVSLASYGPVTVNAGESENRHLQIDPGDGSITEVSSGQEDFSLSVWENQSGGRQARLGPGNDAQLVGEQISDCDSSYYAGNLAPGATVDGDADLRSNTHYVYGSLYNDPACSFFTLGESGFIGFSINRNGQPHYGYMEVEVREGSTIFEIIGGEIESDSDTPITVQDAHDNGDPAPGDPRAVPVGGALPVGLGLLALGALALRRKKH